MKAFITDSGITLEYTDAIRPALGTSSGGRIRIALGLAPGEEFSVLTHETAHELLHHGAERPASKTVRETEAEATAYTVCKHIGLDTGTAAHDYIALYEGDRGALVQSLTTIRDTAARIIAVLDQIPTDAEGRNDTFCGGPVQRGQTPTPTRTRRGDPTPTRVSYRSNHFCASTNLGFGIR